MPVKALKCNMYRFGTNSTCIAPDSQTGKCTGSPELNADRSYRKIWKSRCRPSSGRGEDVDILLDMNFNFKTEGYLRVIRALREFDLFWYELDVFNPEALAYIRQQSNETIASCESLYGHRDF